MGNVPRFYFHLYDDHVVTDDEGKELPDLNAASEWARSLAVNLIGETIKDTGRIVLHHRIDIQNEAGEVLKSVPFSDIVEIER